MYVIPLTQMIQMCSELTYDLLHPSFRGTMSIYCDTNLVKNRQILRLKISR